MSISETRSTETSLIGFGTRAGEPVVLKIIRKENSEEWRSGEILRAWDGHGVVKVIACASGAVLLPRVVPGHNLSSFCIEGKDDEATEVIAASIGRMTGIDPQIPWVGSVERLRGDFERFRDGGAGLIPISFVDRAEALFTGLCATEVKPRLLHGDLHHYNLLLDEKGGWVVIDPWGVFGEIEFEIGASLRNPIDARHLLDDPRVIEQRLRIFETRLECDADRALKWAFATTVLSILWPVEPDVGMDLRASFAPAAHSMLRLLE